MRVLWLCNVVLPVIAEALQMEASNKEGWISGLADVVIKKQSENGIELAVAFPTSENQGTFGRKITTPDGSLTAYGFQEDTVHPERYDEKLEESLRRIAEDFKPDIVHCFGTEYPHTLAMCRVFPKKSRLLISIQGLCAVYADAYFADMPARVIRSKTLRDILKKDSITEQQQKFALRGKMEVEAIGLAKNVSGRTAWDRYYTGQWNPQAKYYHMNETLRPLFYGESWKEENCIPHSIFISQGDYPIKGLHYMLTALPLIQQKYPDARVYVAGDDLVSADSFKQRLKRSGYGRYLRELIRKNRLEDSVVFLGRLSASQMKERYLRSHLFVCCSAIENSPNSLGEAMLLGMPCVSADVGGVPSIFTDGRDGILYEGFRAASGTIHNNSDLKADREDALEGNAERLAEAVVRIWEDENKRKEYCRNAGNHAAQNHDRGMNYRKMNEIYANMMRTDED